MSSKFKTEHKPELIAIYRLEFYKKQTNWKLAKDVSRKNKTEAKAPSEASVVAVKPSKINQRKILNQTYNIENLKHCVKTDAGNNDTFNTAFVDTGSDASPPITPSDVNTANPCTNKHESQGLEESCQSRLDERSVTMRLQKLLEYVPKNNAFENVEQEWGCGDCYMERPEDHCTQWECDPDCSPQPEENEEESWQQECEHHERMQEDASTHSHTEDSWCWSTSSSGFQRGCRDAPHSTETDFTLPPDDSDTPVSCHSARSGEISCHVDVLRTVLQDAKMRSQDRALASLTLDRIVHELTGDKHPPGPSPDRAAPTPPIPPLPKTPQHLATSSCNPTPVKETFEHFIPFIEGLTEPSLRYDPFLAGSFRNVAVGGKERGRLRQEKVIGISMGRPYRL